MKKLSKADAQARVQQPEGSSAVRAVRITSASKRTVARSAVTGKFVVITSVPHRSKTTVVEVPKKSGR